MSAPAASCASLDKVTGFHEAVRFAFSGNATGKDEDSGDHLAITIERQANTIVVDLARKLQVDAPGHSIRSNPILDCQ